MKNIESVKILVKYLLRRHRLEKRNIPKGGGLSFIHLILKKDFFGIFNSLLAQIIDQRLVHPALTLLRVGEILQSLLVLPLTDSFNRSHTCINSSSLSYTFCLSAKLGTRDRNFSTCHTCSTEVSGVESNKSYFVPRKKNGQDEKICRQAVEAIFL